MDPKNIDFASLRELPVSTSNFNEIIRRNLYYVDKTSFIKKVLLKAKADVFLITRPRRFGKTLAMDTLYNFLKINPENPEDTSFQEQIFKDTEIYKDKSFCKEYMGQYPVVFLSLSQVRGVTFEKAYGVLAVAISDLAKKYAFLLDSPRLSNVEKKEFNVIQNNDLLLEDKTLGTLAGALKRLTIFLHKHFERQVIVLIDEYDVPLDQGYANGYYNDMIELMRVMLGSTLKDNTVLIKGVLTGCLRISKESIFTGFNNFKVNSISNDRGRFAEYMGFTKDEVKTMLSYYGLSEYEHDVKEWYDGYRIWKSEIFCPWDVINYCGDAVSDLEEGNVVLPPTSYWSGTGTNNIIQEFMPHLDEQAIENLQTLYDGGQIEFQVNEHLNYKEIEDLHRINDFWTLLLYTGYLTIVPKEDLSSTDSLCTARIPNNEIREAFKECITDYYAGSKTIKESSNEFIAKLLAGKNVDAENILRNKLQKYVSVRDMATKATPENFYHGFLNGIFSCLPVSSNNFKSNAEAGDGYADIMYCSDKHQVGIIIEIKSTKEEKYLIPTAELALKQIELKKYHEVFTINRIQKIYCYGIAFCRKNCFISCKENGS